MTKYLYNIYTVTWYILLYILILYCYIYILIYILSYILLYIPIYILLHILLHNNTTQTYKKAPANAKQKNDRESKKFAKNLSLEDMMECYLDNHAHITLRDHKENFTNIIKGRLINLSKSKVGLVSKCYLSIIKADVSKKSKS